MAGEIESKYIMAGEKERLSGEYESLFIMAGENDGPSWLEVMKAYHDWREKVYIGWKE
jgi:hypothetical protein